MIDVFLTRRAVLRAGSLGLAALARPGGPRGGTAVIQVVLGGGPSHLETYDPKPDAPAEFRGELGAIPTAVPGVRISGLLERQARIMDKLAIIRGVHHATSDHSGGAHWIMTGY